MENVQKSRYLIYKTHDTLELYIPILKLFIVRLCVLLCTNI